MIWWPKRISVTADNPLSEIRPVNPHFLHWMWEHAGLFSCVCGYNGDDVMKNMLPEAYRSIAHYKVTFRNRFNEHRNNCLWIHTRWPEGAEL